MTETDNGIDHVTIVLRGSEFYPSNAPKVEGIIFKKWRDPGGSNVKSEYDVIDGAAWIEIEEDGSYYQKTNKALDLIENNLVIYNSHGVSDITISINIYYVDQCNLEIDSEMLNRISLSGASMTISCTQLSS